MKQALYIVHYCYYYYYYSLSLLLLLFLHSYREIAFFRWSGYDSNLRSILCDKRTIIRQRQTFTSHHVQSLTNLPLADGIRICPIILYLQLVRSMIKYNRLRMVQQEGRRRSTSGFEVWIYRHMIFKFVSKKSTLHNINFTRIYRPYI